MSKPQLGKEFQQRLDAVGERITLVQQRNPSLEKLLGRLLHVEAVNLVGEPVVATHDTKRLDVAFWRPPEASART